MTSLDEKAVPANDKQMQSLQTLIIGRLMVIFLLLVTSWFWYSGTLKLSFDTFPQGLFLVFIISVGLTIIYFFLLRLSKNFAWQLRIQFLLDALLITWLLWRTGDLSSPYITLYIVLISVASFYLRPLATLLMAAICALLFVTLSVLTFYAVIESSGTPQAASKAIQIISFHIVALLVVGLLASRLSDRRMSGIELEETAKSLASLRALHERIVESIRSGLVTTDLDGNIYTFNAAATEITGYMPEQMLGKTIEELFGDIREQIDLSLSAAGDGEPLPRFETDLLTPDGFAVRIGFSVSLLFSETQEATGLIITFQDLTEIRSMEESVRRKDRMAAVGRVAAGLAHEIRNPLGAMRGAIQVLDSDTPKESRQAGLMDIILKESDRLNSIITNFLGYARPAAVDFAETKIAETITDTLTLLKHSPDVREHHELVSEIADETIVISADAAQLKQIFWNLARNAMQAMPDGGKLRVAMLSIPNNRIRITFEDTGVGMSQEQVEQLFEPFSNSTTGGTGLGLSIVYQIVKDHNGVINVRSQEGVGTTITVELPRDNRRVTTRIAPPIPETEPSRLTNFLNVTEKETEVSS
ncbi:MAG: PAS domain S-box protein [Acidobacteria bacterium]|nr:PAS domain S-box protein [Acidobacteriota bacterium]MBP7476222.1 PAS domain S-box protein [Pyrinomonadaceae bacterium]